MNGISEEQAVLDGLEQLIEHCRSKALKPGDACLGAAAANAPHPSGGLAPESWRRTADWLDRVRADFAAGRPIVSVCVALDHQGLSQEMILDPWLDNLVANIEETVRRLGRLARKADMS